LLGSTSGEDDGETSAVSTGLSTSATGGSVAAQRLVADGSATVVGVSSAEASESATDMPMATVIDIVDLLTSAGITVWVDGGWGVDALLGRQTRPHKDLDVALQVKDEPRMRELLEALGFRPKGESYARPFNYILTDGAGLQIDLHLVELDADGNGDYGGDGGESYTAAALSGEGTIGGRPVRCIAAAELVGFHSDYELAEKDFQDVSALCEEFGIPLPEEYERFLDR